MFGEENPEAATQVQFSNTYQKSILITQIVQTQTLSSKPTLLAPISLSPALESVTHEQHCTVASLPVCQAQVQPSPVFGDKISIIPGYLFKSTG